MMQVNENGNGTAADSEVNAATYVSKVHQKGISHKDMVCVYSGWAKSYEKDLTGRYTGHEIVADAMANYYPEGDRAKIWVLDIAAGTGLVGVALNCKGFKLIDALEPSQGMLNILSEKGIYDKKFLSPIGYDPVREIGAESYDALVTAGALGEGHIPIQAIHEMLRIVKKGGMIFMVMREQYLSTVEEYKKFEPFMDQLVEEQRWLKVERKVVPKYSFENNGVLYVYQKSGVK